MIRSIRVACALFALLAPAAFADSVLTYHNAQSRAGLYTVPGLTLSAAGKVQLDTGFKAAVAGHVYAQPLYWEEPSSKQKLLIVATESDWVYALNADTGAEVWKTQVASAAPESTFPCGDISPEGITGTPVIDSNTGTLYLNAMTLRATNVGLHKIYALSLKDGKILPNWPIDVGGAMAARHASFSSHLEHVRSALQFFKGKLYVDYSGRAGDCGNYQGIVIEFDPLTRTASGSWATRALRGGGIWSQGGVSSDGTDLFATTGNTFNVTSWQDGEAVIRLHPGLARSTSTADFYTPGNWEKLDADDADLGGTGAVPVFVPTGSGAVERIIALGKSGLAYLLNSANLGGFSKAIETLQVSNSAIVTGPAIYNTATSTLVAFANSDGTVIGCSGKNITTLKITAGSNPLSVAWCAALNGRGSPIVTTTDGTAQPIVWAVGAEGDNKLHGFNALNGKPVFTSTSAMAGLRHYQTLIAANNHLYVAGDGAVYAFKF